MSTLAVTTPRRPAPLVRHAAGDALALAATYVAVRWTWRDDRAIAAHLEGFACTEAGSALDMLKAAELETDPKVRRLFARHALDEARHASMFRQLARSVHPEGARAISEHALIRATRQNLYQELGRLRFLAFVYLSERRAASQFAIIAEHLRVTHPEVTEALGRILRDERFHVSYSLALLESSRETEGSFATTRALMTVRAQAAWKAWRRAGRLLGDAVGRALLFFVWALVLPIFALAERTRPLPKGWQPGGEGVSSLEAARRQS